MRRLICTFALLAGMSLVAAAAEGTGEQAAREAADRFGRALIGGDLSQLEPILPDKGKIKLKLVHLGPEQGSFSASQVKALLDDFLAVGKLEGFTLTRVEYDPSGVALASARVELIDRQGRPASVSLHVAFQVEADRWVVREIRETPR